MRHRAQPENEDAQDLNLTPYLDVVMNLVLFLLASFTTVQSFSLIDLNAPAICHDCGGAARSTFSPVLTLASDGVLISASDGSVPSEALPGPLDPARLRDALASWKQRYRLGVDLTVSATPATPYLDVVAALDAAREDGGAPLFPEARLARPAG